MSNPYVLVHTLAFNLPSEVEIATRLLYEQCNGDFNKHVIADLGFPISEDKLPNSILEAKAINSEKLKSIAKQYGSEYIQLPNIGVSQNWNQIIQHYNLKEGVIICADPDERPKNNNWVKAIADVIQMQPKFAWVSLNTEAHENQIQSNLIKHYKINYYQYRLYSILGISNWAQGGFNVEFVNDIGEIPIPHNHKIYGSLEFASYQKMAGRYGWCILKDFYVEHTECAHLYREWKNYVIFEKPKSQISFEDYLTAAKGVPK